MVQHDKRLLEELQKRDPELAQDQIVLLAAANLDLSDPQKHAKTLIALTVSDLRVYTDSALSLTVPVEEIESCKLSGAVGCVFVEVMLRNGDAQRIARADSRFGTALGQAVKRINYYLRNGDCDFSRIGKGVATACPKCGTPYPKASQTCPRCSSKKRVLLRLIALAKPEAGFVLISVLLFFITTAIGLLTPYINRLLVDDYIQGKAPSYTNGFWLGFLGLVLSVLAVNVLRRLVSVARGYCLTVAGNNLIVRLRDMVFSKVQQLSIASISRRTSGELMKRVNSDTRIIKQFLINQLPNIMEQGLLLLGVGCVLLFYDWKLALLIILPAPFVALAFRLFWRFMRGMFHRRWELNSRGNAILHDIFSGIRVVKAYGMEKREEERYIEISAKERDAQLRQERVWAILMPLLQLLMGLGEYILLYYVGRQMLNGVMTAGEMSQFSSYAGMVYGPLNALMLFPRHFMHMMTSVTRVYEIMDERVEIGDGNDRSLQALRGEIELEHVSFSYEETDEVLQDISLKIQPGEFIGLVGKSGVGKSTLINLIMRMYDVDEGSIKLDGVDIREIPQELLRARMGVVLQENFLFTGSVWQNLTYAKPNATPEEVIQAAKSAGAHDFIIRLPDGYNTYVGEKGHTLSGGERQRISIARALLHNPKILILDEATSSLDTETEKLIQDALLALSAGRTTIAIAHRLSTLRNANRLVVMDKGKIAEVGSHDELMEKKGIYYGLVMAQREMTKIEA